jgi:hypothetical protein
MKINKPSTGTKFFMIFWIICNLCQYMRTFIMSQLSAPGRPDKNLHIPKLALGVVDAPGTRPRSRTLFDGREDALCQSVLHQFAEHLGNGVLSCPDCEAVFLSKVVSGVRGNIDPQKTGSSPPVFPQLEMR